MSSVEELEKSLKFVFKRIAKLEDFDCALLSQRPARKSWSVLEIVEHLSNTHYVYIDNIRTVLNKHKNGRNSDKRHYRTTFSGRMTIRALKPRAGKRRFKMKTFGSLKPNHLLHQEQVFDKYSQSTSNLLDLFEASKEVKFDDIKVNTAIGNLLRLPLMEAFAFIEAHEARHYQQLEDNFRQIGSTEDLEKLTKVSC